VNIIYTEIAWLLTNKKRISIFVQLSIAEIEIHILWFNNGDPGRKGT